MEEHYQRRKRVSCAFSKDTRFFFYRNCLIEYYHNLPGVVYGVCDEIPARLGQDEGNEEDRSYFGLKTAQGLLEFKCENKTNKQNWVDGVQNLLRQVKTGSDPDRIEQSMEFLYVN